MKLPGLSRLCLSVAIFTGFATAAPDLQPELDVVRQRVAEAIRQLGVKAGVPEEPDKFIPIPASGRWLSRAEAKAAYAQAPAKLKQIRWWKIGLDPATLEHPLREPATVASGGARAFLAGLDRAAECLELAREAGDFLLWAQAAAGTGVFPFPTATEAKSRPFLAAKKARERAAREGREAGMLRNGWVVDDLSDGGLQFDNAEAGVALLDLYEATGEGKYLESARKAADWAIGRPIVPNWNYNSFSVHLLARTYAATGEAKYLEAARRKAVLGVMPGQLTDGPLAGRWVDPHNAKPAYHYIMMRALAELASVLPADDPARPEVLRSLTLGLRARNQDFLGPGAPNKDKAMEALLVVHTALPQETALLRESLSAEALDALGKLVSEHFRRGSAPLGPREWAMFLEFIMARKSE
jgi:hypothetical protein